jgi:hypothetical protein
VSADEHDLALFDDDFDDDSDDDDPASVEFPLRPTRDTWWLRTRWVVVAFAVLVVVALTVGILVFNASAPDAPRGAKSATVAARQFVTALNAGNGVHAAAISCTDFADQAKADAKSGQDPDISYTLDAVRSGSKNDATALLTEHLKFSGGSTQRVPSTISLLRSGGLWLICGRSA